MLSVASNIPSGFRDPNCSQYLARGERKRALGDLVLPILMKITSSGLESEASIRKLSEDANLMEVLY